MVLWVSGQAEEATKGISSAPWKADGVSIDSRTLEPGALFFAIVGEHQDGHQYLAGAQSRGAAAAVVSKDISGGGQLTLPLLRVNDTFVALQEMARYRRKWVDTKYVAVTGSVGKTSTKELLYLVLASQGRAYASKGNLNNHYGVPLSMCNMPQEVAYGIFEMGMNHAGEITPLSQLVRPHIAIITTVAPAHLEFFPSVEAIADAKAEIFCGMERGAVAVLNRDNPYYDRLVAAAKEKGLQVVSFGTHKMADYQLLAYQVIPAGAKIEARIAGKNYAFISGAQGRHQALNAVAALGVVASLGGDITRAASVLGQFTVKDGRGKTYKLAYKGKNYTILDDSYNASPASIAAMLDTLATIKHQQGGRAIAVLGDMFEMGENGVKLHEALAEVVCKHHVDRLYTAGELMYTLYKKVPAVVQGAHADKAEELAEGILATLEEGDIIAVKGSRGMRMENLLTYLRKEADAL